MRMDTAMTSRASMHAQLLGLEALAHLDAVVRRR